MLFRAAMVLQLNAMGTVSRPAGRAAVLVCCNAGEDEEREGEDTAEIKLAPDIL